MNLKYTAFLVTCCLLINWNGALSVTVTCDYIEDVIRGKEDTDGVLDSPESTKGCVRKSDADEYNSTVLAMSNSTIGIMKMNAVRNMPWLAAIYCIYCQIDEIEPGAFQNVSNVIELEFSYGVMTEIRAGVFDALPKLEVLDLRGNKIYNIDDQAFANMPLLRHLNLNENEMGYWKREWFTNTTSILILEFVKNQLRFIPRLAFADFKSIQNIYFDDNKISTIHPDAFKGVKFLYSLGLSNNLLTTLSETIFPNKITIETLDISGNELNYIPSKTLGKLTVKTMYMEGNPWKCPCFNLISFWLDLIGGKPKSNNDDPVCNGPHVPVCVSSTASSCSECVDGELTRRYNTHPEVIKRKANKLCTKGYYGLFYGEQDLLKNLDFRVKIKGLEKME